MQAAQSNLLEGSDTRTSHRLAIKREERSKKKTDAESYPSHKRTQPKKTPRVCATVVKTEPPDNLPPTLPPPDTEVFCEVLARVSVTLLNSLPGGAAAIIKQISEQCRVCWQKASEDDYLMQGDWPNIVEARQLLQELLRSANEKLQVDVDSKLSIALEAESRPHAIVDDGTASMEAGPCEDGTQEVADSKDGESVASNTAEADACYFPEPARSKSHHRRVTKVDLADHTCDICGYKSTALGVKKHKTRHHSTEQYECEVCCAKFGIRYDMRRHRVSHFSQQGALMPAGLALLKRRRPGVAAMTLSELEPSFKPPTLAAEIDENHMTPSAEIRQLFDNVQHVDTQIVSANQMWSYMCELCDFKHTTQSHMLEHNATAHAQTQSGNTNDAAGNMHALCDLCGLQAKASEIILHLGTVHAGVAYCQLCGVAVLGGHTERDRHLQHHLGSMGDVTARAGGGKGKRVRKLPREELTDIRCKLCPRQFNHQSSLSMHMKSHREKPLLQCEMCEFSTHKRGIFNQHTQRKHNKQTSICVECGTLFSCEQNLQFHMQSVHSAGATHECAHCARKFTTKRFLRVHEKRVHFAEKRYFCGVCKKGFFEKGRMLEHEHVHRVGEQREASMKFTCSYCGKRFLRRITMKQHENIHTGRKPYTCPQCGKGFCYTAELRKHMAVHSDARPHRCQHCGKGFKFRYKLTAHVTMHTKQGKHQCGACGKCYTVAATLRRHRCPYKAIPIPVFEPQNSEQTDDAGVIYMCGVCNELFTDQDSVNAHMMLHDPAATPTNMAAIAASEMTICGETIDSL